MSAALGCAQKRGCGFPRGKMRPDYRGFARACFKTQEPTGIVMRVGSAKSLADLAAACACSGGLTGGGNSPTLDPVSNACNYNLNYAEFQHIQTVPASNHFVLSSTPPTGRVWQIVAASSWGTSSSNTPNFFLLAPGYNIDRFQGVTAQVVGGNVPGIIMLGPGTRPSGTLGSIAGPSAPEETSVWNVPDNMLLPNPWRIGAAHTSTAGVGNILALRLVYVEFPCNVTAGNIFSPVKPNWLNKTVVLP